MVSESLKSSSPSPLGGQWPGVRDLGIHSPQEVGLPCPKPPVQRVHNQLRISGRGLAQPVLDQNHRGPLRQQGRAKQLRHSLGQGLYLRQHCPLSRPPSGTQMTGRMPRHRLSSSMATLRTNDFTSPAQGWSMQGKFSRLPPVAISSSREESGLTLATILNLVGKKRQSIKTWSHNPQLESQKSLI